MRPLPENLTQAQRVRRQYKKVLVNLRDQAGFYRMQWYHVRRPWALPSLYVPFLPRSFVPLFFFNTIIIIPKCTCFAFSHPPQDVGLARDAYEQNRDLTNPDEIEAKIQEGEAWLTKYKHWAPYKRMWLSPLSLPLNSSLVPYTEDGTKWQRNDPVPEEVR